MSYEITPESALVISSSTFTVSNVIFYNLLLSDWFNPYTYQGYQGFLDIISLLLFYMITLMIGLIGGILIYYLHSYTISDDYFYNGPVIPIYLACYLVWVISLVKIADPFFWPILRNISDAMLITLLTMPIFSWLNVSYVNRIVTAVLEIIIGLLVSILVDILRSLAP